MKRVRNWQIERVSSSIRATPYRLVVYPAKIDATWLGCPTSPTIFTQSCTFRLSLTYSGPYRIPLMERTSILWQPVKTTWSSSSPRKMPSSGRMES